MPFHSMILPYAYTKERAVAHLTALNHAHTSWTARLSIGKRVGHSSINLYADREYAGMLVGDILGAALYRNKNDGAVEGVPMKLTWAKVLVGVDEAYAHPTAWGTWFCHDITAAIFRRWGLRKQDVYTVAYGSTPYGRTGLVLARIAALVGVPVTTSVLIMHWEWNKFQDLLRKVDFQW